MGLQCVGTEKAAGYGNQGGTADNVVIRPWQDCSAWGAFYFRRELNESIY